MSLDLGFNDLTDLQSMMGSLSSLRHLRLLVLQGNPLALVPYYRGFTIDSLAGLCALDDITVSPSEKHQFRGLSRSGGEGAAVQAGIARRWPYWGSVPTTPRLTRPWLGATLPDLIPVMRIWGQKFWGPGPPRSPPYLGKWKTFFRSVFTSMTA